MDSIAPVFWIGLAGGSLYLLGSLIAEHIPLKHAGGHSKRMVSARSEGRMASKKALQSGEATLATPDSAVATPSLPPRVVVKEAA